MMRRILLGLTVLFATFSIAYWLVPQFRTARTNHEPPPSAEDINSVTLAKSNPALRAKPTPLETIDDVTDPSDDPDKFSIKLLETGEFDDSTSQPKNGERWLGLFEENGKYFVRATTLRVTRGELPRTDVPGTNKPIFLVKNAPMIREGRVTSIFRGFDNAISNELENRGITVNDTESNFLRKDFQRNFKLANASYTLKVSEARAKDGQTILAFLLYDGSTRQVLHTDSEEIDGDAGSVQWIGDIDHDGRPDIYCFLRDGDEAGRSVLFISSKAGKGKLIQLVAEYVPPGC